jgi:micrococcal nuclease
MHKYLLSSFLAVVLVLLGFVIGSNNTPTSDPTTPPELVQEINTEVIEEPVVVTAPSQLYEVARVIDGDTLDVLMNGKVERLRLIGIDTPETVDPRKPVECFGREASDMTKAILTGQKVALESDPSQGERDKYGRLLRYVMLEDGTNFNLLMIREGYAHEYTYGGAYKYQNTFKQAQKEAEARSAGLWGAVCENETDAGQPNSPAGSCNIKGNINPSKEKIYHIPGCGSYEKTVINESAGEKWFCSEQDAVKAGWRKALNC